MRLLGRVNRCDLVLPESLVKVFEAPSAAVCAAPLAVLKDKMQRAMRIPVNWSTGPVEVVQAFGPACSTENRWNDGGKPTGYEKNVGYTPRQARQQVRRAGHQAGSYVLLDVEITQCSCGYCVPFTETKAIRVPVFHRKLSTSIRLSTAESMRV